MQFIYPGLPDLVVTRTEFEEECVSLFLKALNVVIVALRQTNMIYEVYMTHQANMAHQANMTHKVFDEIILSGFAVHIPVFKQVFKLFFGQPDPTTESDKLFKYRNKFDRRCLFEI
jgi:molecular chaperone DnaK (HSP70)